MNLEETFETAPIERETEQTITYDDVLAAMEEIKTNQTVIIEQLETNNAQQIEQYKVSAYLFLALLAFGLFKFITYVYNSAFGG